MKYESNYCCIWSNMYICNIYIYNHCRLCPSTHEWMSNHGLGQRFSRVWSYLNRFSSETRHCVCVCRHAPHIKHNNSKASMFAPILSGIKQAGTNWNEYSHGRYTCMSLFCQSCHSLTTNNATVKIMTYMKRLPSRAGLILKKSLCHPPTPVDSILFCVATLPESNLTSQIDCDAKTLNQWLT